MELLDILIVFCLIAFVPCVIVGISIYYSKKEHKERNNYINDAKNKLENSGLKYNHSYQLTNKDTCEVRFIRIFELKYNYSTKKVSAYCFMTTKEGEIGAWHDDYEYLLDIHTRWNLTDNGEWNPYK